jgi:hypothetical protein
LNFTTKFGTKYAIFREKLYEINCKNLNKQDKSATRTNNILMHENEQKFTIKIAQAPLALLCL